MFGIGTPELIFIFLVGFFIFGPRQLPEIGRRLGEIMAQLRRAADDFKQTWEAEVESERSRLVKDLSSDVKLPDLSVDLAAPSPAEAGVVPAEGTLSRAPARPAAASSALPPAEALAEALPAVEVAEAPLASPAAAPAAASLPVEAPADAAFPGPVFVPRPGAVEAIEAIGYEG
ncbi:twin-arginine translocase TatA/TatE family subunit [Chloracidobacterium sp. MS 40/45]|jgi:Sec-independent protein translocase protein TatA|uniref:twin-arginine translocase TatA/TatE family subunit n=1 Tax=Chloracidobacterium aggregatum TaxID=2851959 RepID=UPI001B8D7858|nr:twin-arginine translocase TatA/TatE family subunit [Chloracidobacterium aggregatum]QUV99721.1 twin-arginine translocase TatA/TatE family subunit [Chloracidobacterium sp. MS 40/45]